MTEEITKDTILIRTLGGNHIVHAIGCPYIADWDIDGCEPIARFKPDKMATCPMCKRMAYTSIGAKDYAKHRKDYERIFTEFKVSANLIADFVQAGRAKMTLINNIMYVHAKQDDWYIDFNYGDVHLFHNNYRANARSAEDDNAFIKGYHEHTLAAEAPNDKAYEAIRQIIKYDYRTAEKVHKKKKKPKMKFSELDAEYWGFSS